MRRQRAATMTKSTLSHIKIFGARAISLVTGRVPSPGTWPMTWGDSRRYAPDRWQKRDAGFEKRRFDYSDALNFLTATGRGTPRDIREGSIPEADLAFIARHMADLKTDRPLKGLHIGNFVGVSLAYLTDTARNLHEQSVVLSIDPNIPHRGIDVPHDLVTGLMTRYGLAGNWVPVTGYTLDRTAVFDILNRRGGSTRFSSYHGFSATDVLNNLARLGSRFDFALIDGNHNGAYLRREIDVLARLLRPGGDLWLDDVDENWEDVTAVFENLDAGRFRRVAHEGRVGVVKLMRRPDGESGARRGGAKRSERFGARSAGRKKNRKPA